MKGIVITPRSTMYIKDFGEPLYQTVGEVVGGYIELVHPKRLPHPFNMIVNEEGLIKQLTPNPFGCYLYKTDEHGFPIVGNIVIMKDGFRNGEPDIVGLSDIDIVDFVLCQEGLAMSFEEVENAIEAEAAEKKGEQK